MMGLTKFKDGNFTQQTKIELGAPYNLPGYVRVGVGDDAIYFKLDDFIKCTSEVAAEAAKILRYKATEVEEKPEKWKDGVKRVVKAFNNYGTEIPLAIENTDFTCEVPEGFTLTREKPKSKRRS